MRSKAGRLTFLAVVLIAAGFASYALADGGQKNVRETLVSFQEVPALSTPGIGEFKARIDTKDSEIRYELTYADTESAVTQAHIHFENATNNGPIVVFLCTNLGNGSAGTQACPAAPATITGTIRPADVSASAASAGAVAAGIGVGEFAELVAAIRAGATYVNVHTVDRAGGEIRAQLATRHGGDDD
jgi:hypothetical protein